MSTPIRPMVRTSKAAASGIRTPCPWRASHQAAERMPRKKGLDRDRYNTVTTTQHVALSTPCPDFITMFALPPGPRGEWTSGAERMRFSLGSITVDRASPVPMYYQVAQQLEEAIESGELPPGSRLDGEL